MLLKSFEVSAPKAIQPDFVNTYRNALAGMTKAKISSCFRSSLSDSSLDCMFFDDGKQKLNNGVLGMGHIYWLTAWLYYVQFFQTLLTSTRGQSKDSLSYS